jgi:acyl-CoA thioesterase I
MKEVGAVCQNRNLWREDLIMKHLMRNIFLLANLVSSLATADEIKIVALGASQTNGKGVANSDAYPAQLERILKAEGYSVSVANEGADGATTRDILSRLSRAVPDGTKIVILQPGTNDRVRTNKRSALNPDETRNNVDQMLAKLRERNIGVVLLGYPGEGGREISEKYSAIWYGQPTKDISPEMIQGDGQHFTKEGYAVLAKNMSLLIKATLDKLAK